MIASFLVLAILVQEIPSSPKSLSSSVQPTNTDSEKKTLRARAATLLSDAQRLNLAGQNDQARADYNDARTLYQQIGDKLGEANVLRGRGDLESGLGRNDQARAAFNDARTLYQQIGAPLGEANVLRGLGDLESKLGRNDQARADYNDARTLYQQVGDNLDEEYVQQRLASFKRTLSPKRRRHINSAH
jgi:tetratricopeptide (TPR) repeat protein